MIGTGVDKNNPHQMNTFGKKRKIHKMFSGMPLDFLERRLHYSYVDIKQQKLVLSLFY